MAVSPIPEGYHTITPYLVVADVERQIEFVENAFDAKVHGRINGPDGKANHAEVQIGNSMLMMGRASERWPPFPAALYLYVPDTDAVYKQALAAGAESVMEPADQFYGDRNGGVKDRFGNLWWIGTRQENLSNEEMQIRAQQAGKQ